MLLFQQIEEISFRSSFFSSEVTKLVSLIVRDVRINKDISTYPSADDKLVTNNLSFHNQKIPPAIITFVQFMAVHVYNISAMLLRAESPEWLVHATAGELHLDGSIIHNARTLLINVTIASMTAKLLRHAVENNPQTCLGELSFGISLEATVIAQGPLSVEKLYIGMENAKSVINEGIYSFAQRGRKEKTIQRSLNSETNLFYKFLPIIPKNFTLKIENSTLNGMREDNRVDFSSTLQCLMLNTQVNPSTSLKPIKEPSLKLPQVFYSFKVENFDVKCNRDSVIELSKLEVNGNYEESMLHVYVVLDTLCICYLHRLVLPWVVNNFLKRKFSKIDAGSSSKLLKLTRSTSWFENFCNNYQISGNIELWKVSVWLNLPEEPNVTSLGFSHTRLLLEPLPDSRGSQYDSMLGRLFFGEKHWSMEWIVESCWCKMGASLLNTDPPMLKKYHTWGTPLFVGMVLIKARSQGLQEIKISSMFDMFRTEWSPNFSQFLSQCLKCITEYGCNGESQEKRIVKEKSKKMVYVTCNFTCTNANIFCIADKKVCLMVRMDKVAVDSHKGKVGIVMEGGKMCSLMPTAIQHSCVRSEEIKVNFI